MARFEYCTMHHKCEPGFVYLVQHQDMFKIGCAKRYSTAQNIYKSWGDFAGVYSRLQWLRRKTGCVFDVIDLLYTPGCVRSFERYLHVIFQEKRLGKDEFFLLDSVDVQNIASLDSFGDVPVHHYEIDLWNVGGLQ